MKKITLLLLFIPLISFTQARFKLKKFADKKLSKIMEKSVGLMGQDHFGKLAEFEYENYHYRFENDTISYTLDFINDPRIKSNNLISNPESDFDEVRLNFRNKGNKDILFGRKNKRKNIDDKKIEDVITMPEYQFLYIDGLNGSYGTNGFFNGKDRLYAAGDPNSYSDTELSSTSLKFAVIEKIKVPLTEFERAVNEAPIGATKWVNVENYITFPDEIMIHYRIDVNRYEKNYTVGSDFKSDEMLMKEGKLFSIKLVANPNWNRKWRISDPDYQKKLSDFMVENEVSIFGKKKKKKKKKKKIKD